YSQEVFEKLLKEAESPVACDGLMILSEIGVRGKEATDLALTHINHPDWTARFYLADHLLSCVDFLSVSQISKSLPLVGDSRADVRCKMMELFSRLALSRIIEAVDLNLGQPDFGLHKKGIAILLDKKFSPKCLDVLFSDSEK